MHTVEFQTIDVGRLEVDLVDVDGIVHKSVFIGRIVLHGNKDIRAISALEVLNKVKRLTSKIIKTVDGSPINVSTIEQFNITKETAELVTFAVYPRS